MTAGELVDLVRDLVRDLPGQDVAGAALVTRRPRPALEAALRDVLGARSLTPVVFENDLEALHLSLCAAGPLDLVIDLADGSSQHRLRSLVLHLRRGGTWVAHVPPGAAGDPLRLLLDEVAAARDSGQEPPVRGGAGDTRATGERRLAALAASLGPARSAGDHIAVGVTVDAVAKVRDQQLVVVGPAVDPAFEEIASVPPQTWHARGSQTSNKPLAINRFPTTYDAPRMSARVLHDVECWPQQTAVKGHVLLPDSFNRPGRPRLRSSAHTDWADLFILRPEARVERTLDGAFFYLDNLFQPHFGHAVTEQLSRLWAWEAACEHEPGVRALVLDPRGELDAWQLALFEAAGVPRERVVVATGPVRVERLLTASQMFSRPDFVHPGIEPLYARVGAALARADDDARTSWPARVFFSRRGAGRSCTNRADVEDLHRRHGFAVVHPEDHPLSTQVRFAREATTISGFAGSGMFQIALAGTPKRVVALAPDTYPAHNEHLFAALLGHDLTVLWSPADVSRQDGRFSTEAFHSTFEVDLGRDGALLSRLLTE